MKEIEYSGVCPRCSSKNIFSLTSEEVNNNYHLTCDTCGKENALNTYQLKLREIK